VKHPVMKARKLFQMELQLILVMQGGVGHQKAHLISQEAGVEGQMIRENFG